MRSRHHLPHRAASPIFATVLMVAITITAGALLWSFRPPLPPPPPSFSYEVLSGQSEPTWGDGSDCTNVNGVQSCRTLPSIDIVFLDQSPQTIPIDRLTFYMLCNGTVYLQAPLVDMEWVPGTAGTPSGSAPQLGHCGTYAPPAAAWNRLAYFHQLAPGTPAIQDGDSIVLYAHSFEPPNCPNSNTPGQQCDDDFHGAPEWCYTVPGACSTVLYYAGQPTTGVLRLPLFGLSS